MFRGSARSLLDYRSRKAASVAACGVAVVGVAALSGWFVSIPLLRSWAPNSPDTSIASACLLLAFAAGLQSLSIRGRHPGPLQRLPAHTLVAVGGLSVIAGLLGGPPELEEFLVRHIGSIGLSLGITPYLGVCSLLGGAALWALGKPHNRNRSALAGVFATLLAVLAVGSMLSQATSLAIPLYSSEVVALSIPQAAALLWVGLTMVYITWRRDTSLVPLPGWAAIALGGATMLTTLTLWIAFSREEQHREQTILATQAEAFKKQVGDRLDETVLRLCQLGSLAMTDSASWVSATHRSFAASPQLQAIAFTMSGTGRGVVRRLEARSPESAARLREFSAQDRSAPDSTVIQVIPASGGDLLEIIVPFCGGSPIGGATLSMWQAGPLLSIALAGATPSYGVVLSAGGRKVISLDSTSVVNPASTRSVLEFGRGGVQWRLEVTPGTGTRHSEYPALPRLVGSLGILLGLLLTLTVALIRVTVTSAQHEERERLARSLESTAEGLWEWHPRTGEGSRSRGIWERLGYDPDRIPAEDQAQRWVALVAPEERPRIDALLRGHLEGRTDRYEAEYRVIALNGAEHWIADRGRVVERDADGRPSLVMGVCSDVTERRLAEEGQLASERQFRAVFDSGYQFEWLLDRECRVIETNRTALTFAGITPEDVRGQFFWETPWWPEQSGWEVRLKKACDATIEGASFALETAIGTADGKQAQIDFSLTAIRDQRGQVLQFLAEGRDITERKRAQDALLEMDALSAMGRVAARVAHEINNPLAGIQNAFLLIKGAIPSTHPHFGYVGAIEREVARIAAITRQLYETYRPERDPGSGAPAGLIISDAIRLLEQINRKSGVKIEMDISSTPGIVPVPAALLRQAIYNLVQNAVEASPPGAVVSARAWCDEEAFWLSVRDHGPGIPRDLRESIFRPFVTTKADLNTGGMGLGLALVRRSVSAMAGRIDILDPPGGGTEIRLYVPISLEHEASA